MTSRVSRATAILATGAVAAFAATSAIAADLGPYKPSQPPPRQQSFTPPPPITDWAGWFAGGHLGGTVDDDGNFLGGGHLGHNWQTGRFVYGAEGDVSFGDEDLDTFGSVRGRLGIGGPNVLAYGTAGVGFDDSSDAGFVGGGGLEFKLSDRTSLGAEALHYSLDNDFTVVRGRLSWHFGGGRY